MLTSYVVTSIFVYPQVMWFDNKWCGNADVDLFDLALDIRNVLENTKLRTIVSTKHVGIF